MRITYPKVGLSVAGVLKWSIQQFIFYDQRYVTSTIVVLNL